MLTLTQLEAEFHKHGRRTVVPGVWTDGIKYATPIARYSEPCAFAEAQCIWFLCPACFVKNGGAVGTHSVEVGFEGRNLLDDECSHNSKGEPSRWRIESGSSLNDLTLKPSIQLTPPCCGWHGYITNGVAE